MTEHICQVAEDAWNAYVELVANGFNDDQALKLTPVVLMTAERRAAL